MDSNDLIYKKKSLLILSYSPQRMEILLQALYDGIFTGLDPIGTVLGHKIKNKYFIGHVADEYSLNEEQSLLYKFRPMLNGGGIVCIESGYIDRSVNEQICKGIGDSVGLAANVILFGLPQIILLSQTVNKLYQEWNIKHYNLPLIDKLFRSQ